MAQGGAGSKEFLGIASEKTTEAGPRIRRLQREKAAIAQLDRASDYGSVDFL
jgi:hypothetical protein